MRRSGVRHKGPLLRADPPPAETLERAVSEPESGGPRPRRCPMPPSNSGPLPAGSLDDQLTARLLHQRIIVLGQEVDDPIANRLCAELLLLSAEDPHSDISLYINSPGGSVSAGLAIYD